MAALVAVDSSATLSEPLQPAQVVSTFEKLELSKPCPCSRHELDDFLKLIITPDPLALIASLRPMRWKRPVDTRDRRWLRELNEPRTMRQIKVQRVVRVSIVSLVLLGTLVWSLATLFAPKNIALHNR